MDAVILLVGDELLSGRTRDANGHWLAGRLDALGYRVRRIVVVPDVDGEIRAEVRAALARAPVVVVSGGLGPTHDDRTSVALASEFGRTLVVDETGWATLQRRYARRFGRVEDAPPELVESARKMVLVPEGARVLSNPVGAASGYALDAGAGVVIVLPGVPAELSAMFDAEVAGKVLEARPADVVLEVDVALPEAAFARDLERVAHEFPDVAVGSYPHFGELRVTLRFRGAAGRVEAARDRAAAVLRERQP